MMKTLLHPKLQLVPRQEPSFQCYLHRAQFRRIQNLAGNFRLVTVKAAPTSQCLHVIFSLNKLSFVLSNKSGFIIPAFLAINVLSNGN